MKNKGFTVLEAIVAIFILSLSISGSFAAVRQGLSQSIIAKDEVTAYYLANEGIEIIKQKIESNKISNVVNGTNFYWLSGVSGSGEPCNFGVVCRADGYSFALSACGGFFGSCPQLYKNNTTNYYGWPPGGNNSGWTATNFKREILIESITPDEISVTVRITWTKGLINREFRAKTLIFNWI